MTSCARSSINWSRPTRNPKARSRQGVPPRETQAAQRARAGRPCRLNKSSLFRTKFRKPELYKKIGEETVEELDVIPTQYFRRIIVREKYVLIDDREAAPIVAPAPERLIRTAMHPPPGCTDHSEQILRPPSPLPTGVDFKYRFSIEISRKTMGNWMYLTANWLTMIYEALRNEIRQSGYIQVDEPSSNIKTGKRTIVRMDTYGRITVPGSVCCSNGSPVGPMSV